MLGNKAFWKVNEQNYRSTQKSSKKKYYKAKREKLFCQKKINKKIEINELKINIKALGDKG